MSDQNEVKKIILEFFEKLDFGVNVEIEKQDELYLIKLTTEEDPAILIGHHAMTLSSIQRLISVILYRQLERKIDVLVDINDYRSTQKTRLEGIADNVGKRVMEESRAATLKSFSPFERRVIHEYIATNFSELTSYSEGEGADRTLVIEKKENKK